MEYYASPVTGHRTLTKEEIERINKVKEIESQFLNLIEQLAYHPIDNEWLSEGRREIQKGTMSIIRAIANN